SYGPEMRGGFAYCRTIISSEEIGSPVGIEPETVIVMHGKFLDVAEELKKGGRLFLNSSLCDEIPQRDDWQIYPLPANELAEEVGSPRVANFVVLGAYLELVPVVSFNTVLSVMPKVIPARRQDTIPLNEMALFKGKEYAQRWVNQANF
ncbi:MAG: 2-oxoacid:acceptor oxidoreductase family protein, partial [bacterium]